MDGGDFLLSNVDKRIVQMEFDNKQFEKDMQVTVKSLHNFEKDLNNVGTSGKAFEGISKSLDNVKANIKGFSLDAVSNAFEKSSTAFAPSLPNASSIVFPASATAFYKASNRDFNKAISCGVFGLNFIFFKAASKDAILP